MSVIVEVARESSEELREALVRLVPQLSSSAPPLTHENLERILRDPSTTLFIARRDGTICGTLTLAVFATPSGIRAWIEDVIVDESARGSGVGEILTRAALTRASEEGARSVDLTSRPSREAANRLYRRLGFELRGTNVYRISIED